MIEHQGKLWSDEDLLLHFDLDEYEHLTLIGTIDYIRKLRRMADEESDTCQYDPQGYTSARVARLRQYANRVEEWMEVKLGWREPRVG